MKLYIRVAASVAMFDTRRRAIPARLLFAIVASVNVGVAALCMTGAKFSTGTVVWNKDPAFFALNDTCNCAFCPKCGSSLAWHYSGGQVWITLGSLDDPEQLKPQFHQFTGKELSWAHLDDDLPHHEQASPN